MPENMIRLYRSMLIYGYEVIEVVHYNNGIYFAVLQSPRSCHQPVFELLSPEKRR